MSKVDDKEKAFINRLLEIANQCIENGTDNYTYEVRTHSGMKMEVYLEFSYEIR